MISESSISTIGLKRYKDSPWLRIGNQECPKCYGKDKGCMVHEDGHTIICTRQPIGAYKEADWANMGRVYFHREGTFTPDYVPSKPRVVEASRVAPVKTLHTQYAQLKKKWPLTDEQRAYLAEQGIFDTSRFSNLPKSPKNHALLPGHWPEGVPGIYHKNGQAYLNTWNYGMLLWQYNADGQLTGAEIRLSEECKAERGYDKPGSVYRPLVSSADWMGGTAPDEFCSVWISQDSDELWFTEGLKKGQVLHEMMGVNVIAMRGVGNYGRAINYLAAILARVKKLRKAVVALDADKATNPAVKSANEGLINLLVEQQVLEVYEAFWDDSQKGIDDALNADLEIEKRALNNQVYIDLQQGRDLLAQTYYDLLRSDKPGMNVIKASAGVGKTWALIDALNRLDSEGWVSKKDDKGNDVFKRIAMSFDNNSLVKEMLPLFTYPVFPLEGRNESEDSLFYCANKSTIDEIAAAGLNTQKYGCAKCTLRSWCEKEAYLGTVEMVLKNRFILTNKAALLNRSKRIEDIDILIMDEGFRQNIQEEVVATPQDLLLYEMGLEAAISDYNNRLDELAGYDNQTVGRVEEQIKLRNDIKAAKAQIGSVKELIAMLEGPAPEHGERIYPSFDKLELPGFILMDSEGCLFPGSDNGFGQRKCWIKPLFNEYTKAVWHMPDGTLLLKSIDKRIVDRLNEMNVINLDATPIDAYFALFDTVNKIDVPVQDNIEVHSILDKKYSKGQLHKNPDYLAELIHVGKQLHERHNANDVILTTKMMAEVLIEHGIPEENIGWYGKDTRGSNKWQTVEAVAILGPYIENLDAVNRDVAVLKMVDVEVDPDELLAQITSAETIQAIARGRGVSRSKDKPLIVYKITNHKIKGVKEDITYANVHDLLDVITAAERSRRTPQQVSEARQKALDFVYQKPVAHTKSNNQQGEDFDSEKQASNTVIASNDTPSSLLYNKIQSSDGWGIIFANLMKQPKEYLTDLFNSLRMDWLAGSKVSYNLWLKFLEALMDGVTSIGDLQKHLDKSKATVMRLRRAFINMVGPLFESKTTEQVEDAPEIASYAVENYFQHLVHKARSNVPDRQVFVHAKERKLTAVPEIKQALEMLEKFPDPAQQEEGIEWYWMCVFNHMKQGVASYVARQLPDVVLQYFLSELDKEILNEKVDAEMVTG